MNFKEWGNQIANMGRPGWIRKGPNISRMYADWKAEREKLIGALEEIKSQPQECQRIMEKHDWKYDDCEDFNQKMIFTMYSHVVECAVKAEDALAEIKEKGNGTDA